jgi:hypothetical protein
MMLPTELKDVEIDFARHASLVRPFFSRQTTVMMKHLIMLVQWAAIYIQLLLIHFHKSRIYEHKPMA